MKLPQIRIETKMGQIGIRQNLGKQEIRQPKADVTIQQPKPQMDIQTTQAVLTIDQTKAWEDMNLMSILRRNEKYAQDGYEGLMEGIARRAEQGQELMKIENKDNPIVRQAIENSEDGMKQPAITFIPSTFAVTFNYKRSEVTINVKENKPIIHAKINQPKHDYKRGMVDIYMKQYQDITFDVEHLYSETI